MQQFDWIYKHQWKLLHETGLYAAAERITVGVVNHGPTTVILPEILADPKCEVHTHPDREQFEYFTLSLLREWCVVTPGNHQVWYFHTKGATTITDPIVDAPRKNGVHYWKCYMEHYSLTQWRECLAALKTHDVCGVEWREQPAPHFSGNFWQANSDYIRRLPPVRIPDNRWDRGQAEMWLCQAQPRPKCFANHGQDLYRYSVLPETYQK